MLDYAQEYREIEVAERLADILPDIQVAVEPAAKVQPEQRGFEMPARIWVGMIFCYAIFLSAMIAALGASGKALLSIAVSITYIIVFFGVARVVIAQNPDRATSPLDRDGFLMTHFGPMERNAVYAQMLVVPACVALFGVSVAAVIMFTGATA